MSRVVRFVLGIFRRMGGMEKSWKAPPRGQLKLNVDASWKHKGPSGASLAGMLRDHKGRVKVSFTEPIESDNNNLAEMQALERGLCLVNEGWFKNVTTVETDCNNLRFIFPKSQYDLIRDIARVTRIDNLIRERGHRHHVQPFEAHKAMMEFYSWRVRQLVKDIGCTVEHVPREVNSAADALSKIGYGTLSLQLHDENDLRKFPKVGALVKTDRFNNSIFMVLLRLGVQRFSEVYDMGI